MIRKVLLGAAVALACASAYGEAPEGAAVAVEPQTFAYEAESFSINESSEEVTVTGMTLELGKYAQLNAQSASFPIGTRPVPQVVELDKVQIKSGDQVVASADSAVFYPELRTFTADAYHLTLSPIPMTSLSLPDHTITCRGGVVHDNGVPVGTSICFNIYGGGSHTLSCSESGTRVKVEVSDQSCSLAD
ncbi:MAG: hypothetical protein K0M70_01635 [Arenimonas sp.]|uniref:hypothetical protein n=1 Tax=Arenimonas sp. TaxID=1872635 RepID=UPI0025C3DF17|nr:hypothetical protein [Arenimonas sp.]MBW8366549.1 hypothetical protein [Arenimonas sp.]